MSDLVPSLIEGYEPRDYLRFDFHVLEVFRDLAEDIEWASASVIRTAVFLTGLFHYRTQGYLRYQVRDPEAIFKEVDAIWKGQGNIWLALSLRDLNEALHGISGKNTVAKGVDFLHEIGLVEKLVPEDFATSNNAARYRFNGRRARELLVGPAPAVGKQEDLNAPPEPDPIPNRDKAIPEKDKATPNRDKAIPGSTRAIPEKEQGFISEGQGLDPSRARAMPFQDQALVPLDPPLYRERNESNEKQRALSGELCSLLAAELDRRLPREHRNVEAWLEHAELLVAGFPGRFDYLTEMLVWTQQDDFWATRITNMGAFSRNIDTIMSQYERSLAEQQAKVYKIDDLR